MNRLFLVFAFLATTLASAAQTDQASNTIRPSLLDHPWPAEWIAHPAASASDFGVFHFRKTISLERPPETLLIHVSADNRYRLFVNGTFVAMGPAQSDLRNWRFETLDIAPYLRSGLNVIAAVVWNGGLHRPMAQISSRTAFILQADDEKNQAIDSNKSWKVQQDRAYQPVIFQDNDPVLNWNYYVAGALERFDAAQYPWGWALPEFDDSGWPSAAQLVQGAPFSIESHERWQLRPRSIPLLPETPRRFARVVRSEGVTVSPQFVNGSAPIELPPNRKAVVLLDHGSLTTGYPVLRMSRGKGAQIRLIYGEALYDAKGRKGNRNEVQGKHIMGVNDIVLPDGTDHREYQPLWTRNWRWLQLELETADEPLILEDLSSFRVVYPAERVALFEPDSPNFQHLWDAGWNTLALTAQETFISDLSWERMAYIADTKVHCLSWLVTTSDDRLVRQAIEQFDSSRAPFGLTQSRYPANLEQYIPSFSLFWVSMVHDYWMYRGDDAFLRQFLPGIRDVLYWFETNTDPQGLRPVPWFAWDPIADTFLFAIELQQSAELFDHFGYAAEAARYRQLAAELKRRAFAQAYDPHRGLVRTRIGEPKFNQWVNSLAVLSGVLRPAEQRVLVSRLLDDKSIEPAELFYRYYLDRALQQSGLADRYSETLYPWEDMLHFGLETFGEAMENSRSDCHPWSTSPVFEFMTMVAGIQPASPGFQTVRIEPALGTLKHIHARMPHPQGMIEIWLDRDGDRLRARTSLPPGITGTLVWKGQQKPLRAEQELQF